MSPTTYAQWMREFRSWPRSLFIDTYEVTMKMSPQDYLDLHTPECRQALDDYAAELGYRR
jgi:hypothetical protein